MAILFHSDWAKYPNPIVHTSTKNRSWVRIVALFKKMGVKNHAFPLALIQPHLEHVDPYDPDLDRQTKQDILKECASNPWYYFREVARFTGANGMLGRMNATRANISMLWSFFNHIDYYLIQPRQTGKTSAFIQLTGYLMNIGTYGSDLTLITQNNDRLVDTIKDLKEARDVLPQYIYHPNRNDADNMSTLTNVVRHNVLRCKVGQQSKEGAQKCGRGSTTPILFVDEFAYVDNNDIIMPAALPGVTTARDTAREAGAPYGLVFMTTAGMLSERRGRYAYNFLMAGTTFHEKYYDTKDEAQLIDTVRKNSGDPSSRVTMFTGVWNHRQLGHDDNWLLERMAISRSEGNDAEKDWLNHWPTGGAESPFDESELNSIARGEMKPLHAEFTNDNYIINWYVEEKDIANRMNSVATVIGLDTSEGLGGKSDAIGFTVQDTETHEMIATGRFNQLNTSTFAEFLADFMVKYKRTVLVFERKSTGISIFDRLCICLMMAGENPFKRVYNRICSEPNTFPKEYYQVRNTDLESIEYILEANRRHFGFNTSGGNGLHGRSMLYGTVFRNMIAKAGEVLHDTRLINEIRGIRIKNNRLDHSDGGHDDMVISALLGSWFMQLATNQSWYGLEPTCVLAKLKSQERDQTAEEKVLDYKKQMVKDEFTQALEEWRTTEDPAKKLFLTRYLERLANAHSDVVEKISGQSLDALKQMLKEKAEISNDRDGFMKKENQSNGSRNNFSRRFIQNYGSR